MRKEGREERRYVQGVPKKSHLGNNITFEQMFTQRHLKKYFRVLNTSGPLFVKCPSYVQHSKILIRCLQETIYSKVMLFPIKCDFFLGHPVDGDRRIRRLFLSV